MNRAENGNGGGGMSMFEVKKNGKAMASGAIKYLPDKETRKQMRTAGYKIYVDG